MIEIRYDQTLKTSASGKIINSIVSEWNESMPPSSTSVHTKLLGCFNIYVSGKLPTYTSPKLTLTLHLRQNVGLGEGWVDSFPGTYNDPFYRTLNFKTWSTQREKRDEKETDNER